METAIDRRATGQPDKSSDTSNVTNFDFDRWAVEVRKQMMASLQKRSIR